MIFALIRFIFFVIPISIQSGLNYIFFDGEDVIEVLLQTQKRKDMNAIRRKVLENHLEKCRRQVYKPIEESKKQPPNDKKE